MSTLSTEFRTRWAAHDIRVHHGGVKSFNHPDAGPLELTYQPLDLPLSTSEAHSLTIHTAEPGSPDEDRLKLLAGLAATPATPQPQRSAATPTDRRDRAADTSDSSQ
ncbi:hypothetical protein [Streptomyces mexicanus]|uniref:MmyB family transcriptional regulator n=1 Tax=Streptomyces mexicanus TaxID=178566 RepID=UPI0031EFEB8E